MANKPGTSIKVDKYTARIDELVTRVAAIEARLKKLEKPRELIECHDCGGAGVDDETGAECVHCGGSGTVELVMRGG